MTDKEKIRKEVERMHNLLPIRDGDNISINYADRICTTLEMYIDSLQEEPVIKGLEEVARNYGDELDNILVVGIDDDNSIGEYATQAFKAGAPWNKDKLDKVIKLADAMYYAAFNMTTDASRLRNAMNDYHNFIIHMNKED